MRSTVSGLTESPELTPAAPMRYGRSRPLQAIADGAQQLLTRERLRQHFPDVQPLGRLAGSTQTAPKASGQCQDRRSIGGVQRLYRIPRAARFGNICDHQPRNNLGHCVVFEHRDNLISRPRPASARASSRMRSSGSTMTMQSRGGTETPSWERILRHPVGDAARGLIRTGGTHETVAARRSDVTDDIYFQGADKFALCRSASIAAQCPL